MRPVSRPRISEWALARGPAGAAAVGSPRGARSKSGHLAARWADDLVEPAAAGDFDFNGPVFFFVSYYLGSLGNTGITSFALSSSVSSSPASISIAAISSGMSE